MAVVLVQIENEESILMNEFFDYNGYCYAMSRSRMEHGIECMDLEDFYDCTIRSEKIDDITVFFISKNDIIGWYEHASIFRKRQVVSVFLEGNIKARTSDVTLLPKADRIHYENYNFKNKLYEVVETDDERYERLMAYVLQKSNNKLEIRYNYVDYSFSKDRLRLIGQNKKKTRANGLLSEASKAMRDACLEQCTTYATKLMNDTCKDIRELKTMYMYAKQATVYDLQSVSGWYYLAMACEQLGFLKEGMKAIEKAIALEPDGDDLIAQKAHLLFAMGNYVQAIELYEEAWQICPEDGYLLHIGQTWFILGNVDAAYKAYKRITDKSVLEERNIKLKDIESKWPFVLLRGFFAKK